MLVGQELVSFVKANPDLNQQELAEEAGYSRVTKTGRKQLLVKRFYHALLAAQGTKISVGKALGKTASYSTTVHKSGIILLGKTYSEKFGLEPGDVLDIDVEGDCIRLMPQLVD
jgi:hypothetical protein